MKLITEKHDNFLYIMMAMIALMICAFYIYTNGYPYIYQNDESYLSYVHAWFLSNDKPMSFSFLTREEFGAVYTHNPNLPRYAHYLLMTLGCNKFTHQLLIITLFAATFGMVSLYYGLKQTSLDKLVVYSALLMLIVNPQFVLFSHNSYRVFSFLLFGLMWYSTLSKGNIKIFLASFILFQFEYAFAIFVASSCSIYLLIDGVHKNIKKLIYCMLGIIVSVAIFAFQIISYQSFHKMIDEMFHITLPARGIGDRGIVDVIKTYEYILNNSSKQLWILYLISIAAAVLTKIYFSKKSINHIKNFALYKTYFSSKFLISIFIGGLAVTYVLSGYCKDAYGNYNFPFRCFVEFALFIYLLTLIFTMWNILQRNKYTKVIGVVLVISFSCLSIYEVAITYKVHPVHVGMINRGTYIEKIKEYDNKHYFTNFGGIAPFKNNPRPLYVSYGLNDIDTFLITYKEKYDVKYNKYLYQLGESIYYICVQMPNYSCTKMTGEILEKWNGTRLVEQNDDYVVIEFSGEVISSFKRSKMSVNEECWVELGLNLLNNDSVSKSLSNTLQVRELLLVGKKSIFTLNPNSKEMLNAFKTVYDEILWGVTMSKLYIAPEIIKSLQLSYPVAWQQALVVGISKSLSEVDGKDFCTEDNIVHAKQYVEDFSKEM